MNIQEIIAKALYLSDYGEEGHWEELSDDERADYKSTAVNVIVVLANQRLHITTIPDIPDDLSPPAKDGRSKH